MGEGSRGSPQAGAARGSAVTLIGAVLIGAVLIGAVLVCAVLIGGCGGGSAGSAPHPVAQPRGAVQLRFGAIGRMVPRGFLGLSIEFQAIRAYTGDDPAAINPVFETLVRNLSPGQDPVLRIGGDSTDLSWFAAPGVRRPWFDSYRLTRSWMATTAALAHAIHARMILGVNLAAADPSLSAAETAEYLATFGAASIAGLEIGNEPNLYASIPQFRRPDGALVSGRGSHYGPPDYRREVRAVVGAMHRTQPAIPLVGPAFSAGPTPGHDQWTTQMGTFIRGEPSLGTLSIHRYPLKPCFTGPGNPQYPTVSRLLSGYSTVGLADGVRHWVRLAHSLHRSLRIDELNSVACRGKVGVSNTFASALWATDALFSLVNVGVDAVNVHTLPDSEYELFTFADAGGHWSATVMPVYYGLELFAQAAPAGARMQTVTGATHGSRLSVWATETGAHTHRLVLINKDPGHAETVEIPPPASTTAVTVERMTAPAVTATAGVALGGRSYGTSTRSGTLAASHTEPPGRAPDGDDVITVPGGSAALVTFTR